MPYPIGSEEITPFHQVHEDCVDTADKSSAAIVNRIYPDAKKILKPIEIDQFLQGLNLNLQRPLKTFAFINWACHDATDNTVLVQILIHMTIQLRCPISANCYCNVGEFHISEP